MFPNFGIFMVIAASIVCTNEESRGPGYDTATVTDNDKILHEQPISNVTTSYSPGVIITAENITQETIPKISHTFFAKLNTGLFVQAQKNQTASSTTVQPTTGRFPVGEESTIVVFQGVDDDNITASAKAFNNSPNVDTNIKALEERERSAVNKNTIDSLERSRLQDRINPEEETSVTEESDDCLDDICDYFVNEEEVFQREPLMNKPIVTVRMFMPPDDDYFYFSSDTLQDLWTNHINADSLVPLDIVETSSSELMEYYIPPPDPNFVVPVMATPFKDAEHRNDITKYTSASIPLRTMYDSAHIEQNLPFSLSIPVNNLPSQIYSTAQPATDQVLPRPPPMHSTPYRYTDIVHAMYTTPVAATYGFPVPVVQASSPERVKVPLGPQYRVIPQNEYHKHNFPRAQIPFPLNHTLISNGINNILGKVPPSLVVHSPTNMPTLDLINAVAGALPGILQHGPNPHYANANIPGGQNSFPNNIYPVVSPSANVNSVGVMVTPHSDRKDPIITSDVDEAGDTHLIIRLRKPGEPPTTTEKPEDTYSEVILNNGQKIKIRIKEEDIGGHPTPHQSTRSSPPLSSTSADLVYPLKPERTQVVTPLTPTILSSMIPFKRMPADERLSLPNLSEIKGNVGQIFNKGGSAGRPSGYTGNPSTKGGFGNIGGLFNKGSLQNLLRPFNKGNLFNTGGLGNLANSFNKGNLFNKGNIKGITNDISGSISQVQNKFNQLVRPLQTKLDSSFGSAFSFLQMFFGNVIPGNYYENVLTILAIIAFLAFVHVRITLMVNSLGQSVSFNFLGKAEEVLNNLRQSDQVLVMQDLASDVYKSIERWAEEKFSLPSSWTSDLLYADAITNFFSAGATKDSDEQGDSTFSKKTLFISKSNESLPVNNEKKKLNITDKLLKEVEEVARMGSALVDLTWRHGASQYPVSGSSCLQRPICDLNTLSDQHGGLSSLIIPIVSTCIAWASRPPEDAFTLVDTFRPLWLSNSLKQGEGCRRIHTCHQHA
ncbi:hypothetical protein SK128_001358 [Halocaridina rubra]|uniref:Uncharacterized protein n=1 Tax=Halocaridina rubra TaxID=373956 RepID=A0AAN8XCT5_HALRR